MVIDPTTKTQITNANSQLIQIRTELNQLVQSRSISLAEFNFLDHLLSATNLLSLGVSNLITTLERNP